MRSCLLNSEESEIVKRNCDHNSIQVESACLDLRLGFVREFRTQGDLWSVDIALTPQLPSNIPENIYGSLVQAVMAECSSNELSRAFSEAFERGLTEHQDFKRSDADEDWYEDVWSYNDSGSGAHLCPSQPLSPLGPLTSLLNS
jgi:hypothetical protein